MGSAEPLPLSRRVESSVCRSALLPGALGRSLFLEHTGCWQMSAQGCRTELPVFPVAVGRDHSASRGLCVPWLVAPQGQPWRLNPSHSFKSLSPLLQPISSSPAFCPSFDCTGPSRSSRIISPPSGLMMVALISTTKAFTAVPGGVFD